MFEVQPFFEVVCEEVNSVIFYQGKWRKIRIFIFYLLFVFVFVFSICLLYLSIYSPFFLLECLVPDWPLCFTIAINKDLKRRCHEIFDHQNFHEIGYSNVFLEHSRVYPSTATINRITVLFTLVWNNQKKAYKIMAKRMHQGLGWSCLMKKSQQKSRENKKYCSWGSYHRLKKHFPGAEGLVKLLTRSVNVNGKATKSFERHVSVTNIPAVSFCCL